MVQKENSDTHLYIYFTNIHHNRTHLNILLQQKAGMFDKAAGLKEAVIQQLQLRR